MTGMAARRLGWVLLPTGAIAVLTTPTIGVLSGHLGLVRSVATWPYLTTFFALGAFALVKRPDHPAARRLLAWAVTLASGFAIGAAYSAYLQVRPTPDWAWCAILVLQATDWAANAALPFALFAVFADGCYGRSYERRAVRSVVGALPVLLAAELVGSPRLTEAQFVWADHVTAVNPVSVRMLAPVGSIASFGLQAGILVLLGAVVVLVIRYRRAAVEERKRIAWPLYALGLSVTCFAVLGFLHPVVAALPDWQQYALYYPVVMLVPASLIMGLLKYRLLDIDLVVRRSLVYGALWLLIGAGYLGVAAAFGVVVGERVPLRVAIVLTILATVVAAPARRRLERFADRLVFGRRLSGYDLIIRLGERLQSMAAPEDVAQTVATSVQGGLNARWCRVILDRPQPRPVAAAGVDLRAPTRPVIQVPLVHVSEVVGIIECGPKIDGRYTAADEQLLETFGRQAALAISNSQLSAELSERLNELAASRVRLVHAEETGRRRLERDIHDGVQQELVAVLARLGLARNQLRRDADLAQATLDQVQSDARRALETLQELVRGIHPPVLTDRGLLEAVQERATRLPIRTDISSDGLARGARFPPEVEGAAYFFVSEALTNVLKHAEAHRAWICFSAETGGRLLVEVRDDGRGFRADATAISGLRGLQDRIEALGGTIEVASAPGCGTTVRAALSTGAITSG